MKAQKTDVWFYVPTAFDAEAVGLRDQVNEAHWLLHKIIAANAQRKHTGSEYARISRQTMESFIHPKDVTNVKDSLLESGIIECNGDWLKGSHSMGYRLSEGFRSTFKRIECGKTALARKVRRNRLKRLSTPVTDDQFKATERYLLDWLRKVKIDTQKAYDLIDVAVARPKRKKRRRRSIKVQKRKKRRLLTGYAKAINRLTVDQIATGDFDFAVCQYGRVHTPVTRLLTEARSCLSFDGEPLASIDIRNSQIVFFAMMLMEDRLKADSYENVVLRVANDRNAEIECGGSSDLKFESDYGHIENVVLRVANDRVLQECVSESELKFMERTFQGLIYDDLLSDYLDIELEAGNPTSVDRKSFKSQLFKDIFYGNSKAHYVRDSKLATIFRTRYPSVWDFIGEQKAESYKHLARKMQQRESQFMIHGVIHRLMTYHPEIPVLTIHDSVMCPVRHVATVERIIRSEFERLGVRPALKIELPDQQVHKAA
jgi:hypothetical protein